ncbi:MAG: hypothetical protein J6U97_00110 [Bacteroidaceae bacterium]|nr:hypothetical protein [Bacteroidaceae bacterium]
MKDIYDTFGGSSKEYMNALKQVKENLPESVLEDTARKGLHYEGAAPDEPLQFSRGKASKAELEAFQTDLQELRKEQKESGTARKQSEKYYEDAEARGLEKEDIDIKEEAEKLFEFDNSTNDWYDAIMSNENISDDEKEEIRDLYSDLFENYEDASFRDRLEEACRDILRKADIREASGGLPEAPEDDFGFFIDEDDLL